MGCDIHGWVEKRRGKKWVGYAQLKDDQRNYGRFAALAGVRGLGPGPNGVPKNVSDTVKLHILEWDTDGHSHSWLPLEKAFKIFKESSGSDTYYEFVAFGFEIPNKSDWKLYRLIFWFDN